MDPFGSVLSKPSVTSEPVGPSIIGPMIATGLHMTCTPSISTSTSPVRSVLARAAGLPGSIASSTSVPRSSRSKIIPAKSEV
jgi:hypothetical protein